MPSYPPPLTESGLLPVGRWTVTREEARAYVAIPNCERREKLWQEWEGLLSAIKDIVQVVPACWMAGSFFSSKEEPGDLDCQFVLRHKDILAAESDPDAAQLLQIVANNMSKEVFKLDLDTFILPWWPRSGPKRGSLDRQKGYLENRGYWDDLWLRKAHTGADIARSAVPSRGYLEVIIDGYA